MNTYRSNAMIAGVLYIVGTVAGILSLVLSQPVRAAQDSLASVAASANQVIVATLCVLLMSLALAMVPVVLHPILRKYNAVLALGYVVFRGALETVATFVTVGIWLLVLALGQLYVQAGSPAASGFSTAAALLLKAGEFSVVAGIVFCLGALMFYTVLVQSRLVPRWLSVWGLAAVIPYLAAEFLALFALLGPLSTTASLLFMPMAVQEMVLAVWLIVKGFSPAVLAAGAARRDTNGL